MGKWWEALPRPEWSRFERVLPDTHWFEIYRVTEGVFAIYEPGHFEECICFLIVGDNKALLFDTGMGLVPIKPVVKQLTSKALVVVNSHSHYDHVGGNHEFESVIGRDCAFYHESAQGLSNAEARDYVRPDRLPVPPFAEFLATEYEIRPWRVGDCVADGDLIELGGRTLEVIETPGETPDGISLLDRENRLLFPGDIFYLGPLYAHLPESDLEAYRRSVDRLVELRSEVDLLLTPHNVPVVGAEILPDLQAALQFVADNDAPQSATGEVHEYRFAHFSILVAAK